MVVVIIYTMDILLPRRDYVPWIIKRIIPSRGVIPEKWNHPQVSAIAFAIDWNVLLRIFHLSGPGDALCTDCLISDLSIQWVLTSGGNPLFHKHVALDSVSPKWWGCTSCEYLGNPVYRWGIGFSMHILSQGWFKNKSKNALAFCISLNLFGCFGWRRRFSKGSLLSSGCQSHLLPELQRYWQLGWAIIRSQSLSKIALTSPW